MNKRIYKRDRSRAKRISNRIKEKFVFFLTTNARHTASKSSAFSTLFSLRDVQCVQGFRSGQLLSNVPVLLKPS